MRADNGRIDEEVARYRAVPCLEALPEPAPDAARFPAAKAVVDGVPVPKIGWEVAPGRSGACEIPHRLDKQPITERRRAASTRFQAGEDGRNFCPRLIIKQ
jgi:hypothetical protein